MKVSTKKRFLAWVIAFLMVVTYMPSVAYASGDADAANAETTAVETEPADSQEEPVETEAVEVSDQVQPNTAETETEEMYDEIPVLGADVLVTNSKATGTIKDGVITITAPGKASAPTANIIKVYNNTDYTAVLSFDYEASNYSAFSEGAANGTYTATLEPGKEATLSLTGKEAYSNHTAVLVMSNFSLIEVQETSEVTFSYDKSLGSITVAGQAAASGDKVEVAYEEGTEIVATPASGVKFLGWIVSENNENNPNKILSKESEYTFKPTEDIAVEAVFVGEGSEAYFMAGDKFLYEGNLTQAANKAKSLVDKTVVLMNDAALTGSHTIPAGVTFLVPFDDANTVYTKAPEGDLGSHVKTTVYRQLTMAAGSSITVDGILSLSAKHHAAVTGSNGGSPTGDVSQIVMEDGSDITVNNGGELYAYGYITGEGNVTAESGALIYEYFQFEDWRGGTASLGIANDFEHGVFPISQYYVQNIEVPLKLKAGASEFVYTSVNIGGTSVIGAPVEFMGSSDAMFNLEDGYVVKSYDGTTDRLNIEAEGEMNLAPITARMGSNSVPTKDHELPINSNITVKINDGTYANITQDLALLPGAEIIIDEGATCVLNDGVSIYAYDREQWGNYCGAGNALLVPLNYSPSQKYKRTEADLVDAKVQVDGYMDASKGAIYSTVSLDEDGMVTSGGANIYSEAEGTILTKSGEQKFTYQFSQKDTEGGFVDIRIFPALLTNEDGSTIQTWDFEEAGTYTYTDGKWVCSHDKTEKVTTAAKCEEPGVKTVTCALDPDYHTYSYEVAIPATGHKTDSTNKTNAKSATCLDAGNVAYWTCINENCGQMFLDKDCTKKTNEKDVVVPALNHDLKQHEAKEPTCTEIGWAAYVTCEREGCGYTTYEEKAATDHDITHKDAVAKTCTTDGNEEYWYCNTCKKYFADKEFSTTFDKEPVIKASHEMEYFDETPATCTEPGQASGGQCKNCDHKVDAGVIEPLGHAAVSHAAVPVTCTADGNEAYWTCSREGCDMIFSDADCKNVIDAVPVIKTEGHKAAHYEAVEAKCTETGNEEYWVCETCNKIFADAEFETVLEKAPVIKALNHDLTKVDAKDPTCTEKGNKEYWVCDRCDKMFEDEDCDVEFAKIPEIAAKGHTPVEHKAVKAKCEEAGNDAYWTCGVEGCDMIFSDAACTEKIEAIPVTEKLGHALDDGVITKNPTTQETGVKTYSCTRAGCEYKEIETIEKLEEAKITNYSDFIKALEILEDWAFEYAVDNNVEDPAMLVIKYVRTGVDRYNSGSWEIMAGLENTDFAKYVAKQEAAVNEKAESDAEKVNVTGLKNVSNFKLPNGDYVDFGHMFGTIDISYTNKTSINHADVAGFFGDTTDLLTTADRFGVSGTIEEMVKKITNDYFLVDANWDDKFGNTDMLGDLDGYYVNRELISEDYERGALTDIIKAYFTKDLTEEQRAEYYLTNRLQCGTSKAAVRDAVYMAYTGNSVISTLEGTREFNASGDDLEDLRKAVCYVVADYICRLAGDYVEYVENNQFTVQSEQFATLAPGITQEIKTAKKDYIDDDGQKAQYNMKYYIATADITRDDVMVWANYPTRPIEKDANGNYVWDRKRVSDQAEAAQKTYGDPESELYIENFNVIASTNADGYDMTGNKGEPGGLLVMDGEEIYPIQANGFFGITKDGKAVIGSSEEYNKIYRGQMKEAVGGFGSRLVADGKIVATATGDLHSRTAVGITGSGKVVMMVLDGRQELSMGGDMLDLAHIMHDAGCVEAINLDGGGSSTYVAKQPGEDALSVMNSPSDGYQRDVASSLMAISTAKSSTVFDHAVLKAPTNYMTVGSTLQMTADGVTSTGNAVEIPAGAKWMIPAEKKDIATISDDGVLTALRTGSVDVKLMLDGIEVGSKRITVVIPDKITFTKASVDVVYESEVTLPIKAYYEGKAVTVNADDFNFVVSNPAAGEVKDLKFVAGSAETKLRVVEVTASVKEFENVSAKVTVRLYNQGENTFDFDKKTGGDRAFAWSRTVSNSATGDNTTYYPVEKNKDMETSYVFAIDMTSIPIPEVLEELTDMLPGHDVEGASAWTYLCNLAQRISDITEVTAEVKIDKNFELVNPEKITVNNEYFKLKEDGSGVVYDKEKNTLTLKLNWVRQYSPIDIEMANPLCLVNGIKLVPKKDADWGANKTLNAVNEGTVSYKVYMRASSLYTFAKDPANQEKYGLKEFSYTYIDKNGIEQTENGGGFESTYKTFKDSYNLVNAEKNGWIVEDGGWRYYKNGEYLTGVQQISEIVEGNAQSLYYDFGEEGIIKGSKKETYTGLVKNSDGSYSYSSIGILIGGWIQVGDDWHYFKEDTKKSLGAGKHKLKIVAQNQNDTKPGAGREYETITNTVTYDFDATGKVLSSGTLAYDENGNVIKGTRFTDDQGRVYFYYGPAFLCGKWTVEGGKTFYYTRAGYLDGGIYRIKDSSSRPEMYYRFDQETYELIQKCEGFVKINNYTYYYATEEERASGKYVDEDLIYGRVTGLQYIDGKYYYFSPDKNGRMLTGKQVIDTGVEGQCASATFHKTKGYAVDSKGKALTKIDIKPSHSYSTVKTVKATASKDGYRLQRCKSCGVEKKVTINKIGKMSLSTIKYTYNGKMKKPTVTVKDSKGNKISSSYYTVSYAKGRKAVGRYKVTVTFKTRYKGTKTAYFTIVPKAPASANATLYGYDDVKFSWKKVNGASGYTVYFKKATADKFTRLKRTTGTSVKKANLTDGVQYTFKVVPYYKKNGTRYDSIAYRTAKVYTMKKLNAPVVTRASNTTVKVAWNNINGETGYQISKAKKKLGTNIVSTYKTTSGKSKTIKAAKNTNFYYKVRPYKTVGKTKVFGPWSAPVKFKLTKKAPATEKQPENVTE